MLATVVPLADTFTLASLPTATKTIYLDFEGERVRNTAWNTQLGDSEILCNPWSIDAPFAFSDDELLVIQHVWARVAEDFAPFNVNVTTRSGVPASDLTYTGPSDARWGIRVVISNGDRGNDENPAEGGRGLAIAKSIRSTAGEAVCFVTSDSSINLNPSDIAEEIANIASMQVGLALGLERHGVASTAGSGSGGSSSYNGHGTAIYWSPLMGNPYIDVSGTLPLTRVSQWSRGEYVSASRPGQDDVGIIGGVFGFRADDHAASSARPTALARSLGDTKWRATGVIGRNTDIDAFAFNVGNGQVTINVRPLDIVGRAPNVLANGTVLTIDPYGGANLDVEATLWSAAGRFVADLSRPNALDASFTGRLPPGRYILKVSGSGNGVVSLDGYSDYGSLGQYSVEVDDGTPPAPALPSVAIAGPASSVIEGALATFTITISDTSKLASQFRVGYRTVSGTAIQGRDFTSQSGTVTFRRGGPVSIQVSIRTIDDRVAETDESFTVEIVAVPVGAGVTSARATAILRYNDGGSPVRSAMLAAAAADTAPSSAKSAGPRFI